MRAVPLLLSVFVLLGPVGGSGHLATAERAPSVAVELLAEQTA